jgi:hypothetical protein
VRLHAQEREEVLRQLRHLVRKSSPWPRGGRQPDNEPVSHVDWHLDGTGACSVLGTDPPAEVNGEQEWILDLIDPSGASRTRLPPLRWDRLARSLRLNGVDPHRGPRLLQHDRFGLRFVPASLGRVEDRILTKAHLSVEVALQRRFFQLSRAEDLLAGPGARRAALRRPEPPKSVIEHPEPAIELPIERSG